MVQDEKQTELCLRILQTCRAELCDLFPYLDAAFDCLRWRLGAKPGFSVDGQAMYFPVRETLKCYSREPAALRRGYLHMLLHCLFLHLFKPAGEMWDLACDMAVEQMIERQAQPRLALENAVRKDCFDRMGNEPLPAERILELLEAGAFPYTMEEMRAAFSFDDHSRWDESATGGLRSQWEQMLLDAAKNKAGKGKRGTTSGTAAESPMETAESKYDYRKFLQRFTFPREEVELDTESFDYIFYNFGMEQYGSMPLIEPLEYKEVRRLEELVIAIDTSGSVQGDIVQSFLQRTCDVLRQSGSFTERVEIYLIQCDAEVQSVERLTSLDQLHELIPRLKLRGFGGTDFRPVFAYVDRLLEEKKLTNLNGLLYFTDGVGTYPEKSPAYKTAFIFNRDDHISPHVPSWAIRAVLTTDNIRLLEPQKTRTEEDTESWI